MSTVTGIVRPGIQFAEKAAVYGEIARRVRGVSPSDVLALHGYDGGAYGLGGSIATDAAVVRAGVPRAAMVSSRVAASIRAARGGAAGVLGDVSEEQRAEYLARDFSPYKPMAPGNPAVSLRLRERLAEGGTYSPQKSGSWTPRRYQPIPAVNCHTPQNFYDEGLGGLGDFPNLPGLSSEAQQQTQATYAQAPAPSLPGAASGSGVPWLDALGNIFSSFLNLKAPPAPQVPQQASLLPTVPTVSKTWLYVGAGLAAVAALHYLRK